MSATLRFVLILGIIAFVAMIIILLRKKSLNLKYSLLWMLVAVILLVMVAWPQLIIFISKLIGIAAPINAIFLAFIFFILLLLMSLTAIASGQQKKIKTLIQNVAMLQKQIEDLEKKI